MDLEPNRMENFAYRYSQWVSDVIDELDRIHAGVGAVQLYLHPDLNLAETWMRNPRSLNYYDMPRIEVVNELDSADDRTIEEVWLDVYLGDYLEAGLTEDDVDQMIEGFEYTEILGRGVMYSYGELL